MNYARKRRRSHPARRRTPFPHHGSQLGVCHAYNMAPYILANDRPIQDGDTIAGATDGRLDQGFRW